LGDGNQAIVDALREVGALLKAGDYGHEYPYDWRTKKSTIFRATDQWFASVEGFRDKALEAVDSVSLIVCLEPAFLRMKSTSILWSERNYQVA
jgi:isoleucyl-tRNA synthetase